MAEKTPVIVHRNERVLAYMIASAIGLSLVCMIALFIGAFAKADFKTGVWPAIGVLPLIGLPIGLILIIAYIVVSTVRRARAARDAQ